MTKRFDRSKIDRLETWRRTCDSAVDYMMVLITPTAIKPWTKCRECGILGGQYFSRSTEYRGSSFIGEACLRLSLWHYGETLTSDLPASCVRARI